MGAGISEGDDMAAAGAAAGARRASAVVKPGRRKSTKGGRNRNERRAVDALEEESGGGGMMESVSLTTSVEVTVLDSISVGEERDRSSAGRSRRSDETVGVGEQAACGTNGDSGGRQQHTPTASDRVELQPLKHQQPKGWAASSIGAAGTDGGQDENAGRGAAGLVANSSPSAVASSVSQGSDWNVMGTIFRHAVRSMGAAWMLRTQRMQGGTGY